jgi:hypothetical protein
LISAYRSPKFNDSLAKKGRRVAAESRHTRGEAIDFGLTNVNAENLGKWLWDNFEGGLAHTSMTISCTSTWDPSEDGEANDGTRLYEVEVNSLTIARCASNFCF